MPAIPQCAIIHEPGANLSQLLGQCRHGFVLGPLPVFSQMRLFFSHSSLLPTPSMHSSTGRRECPSIASVQGIDDFRSLFPLIDSRFLLDLRQVNDKMDVPRLSKWSFSSFNISVPDNMLGNLGESLEGAFDVEAQEPQCEHVAVEGLIQTVRRSRNWASGFRANLTTQQVPRDTVV